MGSLFGGYLSQHNEVWLIDIDQQKVDRIKRDGVTIYGKNGKRVFHPKALTDASVLGIMDLVIVFVKAMYSRDALEQNKHLIGEDTYVMTLQNGAGHEETLLDFVSKDHLIIGTTEHNSSIREDGYIGHGGSGKTSIGLLQGNNLKLQSIAKTFSDSGFDTTVSGDVEKRIWHKLFMNTSASAMTAVLQVKLGYVLDNKYAWSLVKRLVEEAVSVANAEGMEFILEEVIADIKELLENVREGYTSIYADIRNGVPTEVDTISGSVVRKAKKHNISVPNHEFVVALIHALEGKKQS